MLDIPTSFLMTFNKTEKRRQTILGIISKGDANVEELSLHFGISESTIRRDLTELANNGRIVRTYGGAALLGGERRESSLGERIHIQRQQKNAIARLAALQIGEGDTVILDAGTTTAALAWQLSGRNKLHVITNNIAVLIALSNEPEIALTVLGGSLRKMSMGTVGPLTELVLDRMSADKVFLGADGLVAGRGLCEATQEQAALKEKMIGRATEIFVLADASKLGFAGQPAWTPLDRPWTLITDADAMPSQLAPFEACPNITVMIADAVR
ncbi:MAG: DeoR/GlpR family DNA-binding transcription regulator [Collimonas pratensis]|uniref:DeoR/GlpR family DNA-binding transcription regulator n=1 Tax=Collimonas pratensis TaxID=279113 RepID=UPI003C72EC96